MATIEKKVLPQYFQQLLDGTKTFELRIADFACEPGDELLLREWDKEKRDYTGRELRKQVVGVNRWMMEDLEQLFSAEEIQKYGFQSISLK